MVEEQELDSEQLEVLGFDVSLHFFLSQSLQDEIIKSETKYHLFVAEKEILSFRLQQASDEIKLYLSNDPQDRKKSLR